MTDIPGQGNLLLKALSDSALQRANVRVEDYPIKNVLMTSVETPEYVFFPHAGAVCSIVRTTTSGQMVEAGVVGREGVFNVHTVLTDPYPTGSEAIVQNEGRFSRMDVSTLRTLMDEHPRFRDGLLAFTSLFLDQVTQNLLCNRLHAIEQRLAKWLLVMRDRTLTDDLHLTQEFLSYMLGVHRPGVSLAVTALEDAGLIRHRRNWITLVDHDRLTTHACECQRPLHERLTQFIARHQDLPRPRQTQQHG